MTLSCAHPEPTSCTAPIEYPRICLVIAVCLSAASQELDGPLVDGRRRTEETSGRVPRCTRCVIFSETRRCRVSPRGGGADVEDLILHRAA